MPLPRDGVSFIAPMPFFFRPFNAKRQSPRKINKSQREREREAKNVYTFAVTFTRVFFLVGVRRRLFRYRDREKATKMKSWPDCY